jgi:DNA-binding transcriptional regulator LsrR (DeoR family)
MARPEELRLWARVASLYYEHKLKQTEVAKRLGLSQASVSRALRRAEEEGIVRITVSTPSGTYPDLEDAVRERHGLREVIVVDPGHNEREMLRNLGSAAAFYVESTLDRNEVIGISSWSETLLAMTRALHPVSRPSGGRVLQILGGVGNPVGETHASQLTRELAEPLHADVTMLPAPGIVGSRATREVMLADPYVAEAIRMFSEVTLALVGIGAITPSKLLASSGNVFTAEELHQLQEKGAVGDICLRFFDSDGVPVMSDVQDRVISMELEQLRRVRRSVGIAGGARKVEAITGAVRGRWVNVLITDAATAAALAGVGDDMPIHKTDDFPRIGSES